MSNYYDINTALSYNALFNFVIGNRSSGKSYSIKKAVINKFLKTGQQFVYLRRYLNELKKSDFEYFDDIIQDNVFPDHKIVFDGGIYYLDGEIMGYSVALTQARHFKSAPRPKVWIIIFEEYIIEEAQYGGYLRNEVKQFLGLYQSIDRYRGVIVVFLGNNYNTYNPYTLYFNLEPRPGQKIVKQKDGEIILFFITARVKEQKASRFGKIVAGTDYGNYAIENKSMLDNDTFIEKKKASAHYYFSVVYNGATFGVWRDLYLGKMYISEDTDPSKTLTYALTTEDHNPNTMLLKSITKSPVFKQLIEAYKDGYCYFESARIKSVSFDIFKTILNI